MNQTGPESNLRPLRAWDTAQPRHTDQGILLRLILQLKTTIKTCNYFILPVYF